MRVGIDIQHLRMERRGIYYYIWNLLEQMCRLDDLELTLFLYGDRWMDEPHDLERLAETFHPGQVAHYWDAPSLHLLSQHFGNGQPALAPPWVQYIDRNVLYPLWQLKASRHTKGSVAWPRKTWWFPEGPLPRVDVFHHTAGVLFPTSNHANVLTMHDLIPFHSPAKYPGGVWMFMDTYRNAGHMDMILTYSEYTRRDVIHSLGVPADNVRMIPLAAHKEYRRIADEDQIRQVQAKYGLVHRPYFITIGYIEDRKNFPRLIRAFLLFKQEEPPQPHQLVIVGEGPRKELQDHIHALHLTPHVKCLGFVGTEDLPLLLNGAEAFVFPSLYEGFGLPPLEAMACGAPVIASNTTSVPEVVGSAGLLVDPMSEDDMAAAMYRVATNPHLRATMHEQSLARAEEFSWVKTARLTGDAYAEAWRRYQRKDRALQRRNFATTYLRMMREYMIQQRAPLYVQLGVAIDMWPF